jgi:hypothetical protein
MAVSDKPWGNISDSDYKDAATFCKYCLIDMNEPGKDKVKNMCKLPVYEPDGTLNRNGVHAAAARINQVDAPLSEKRKAAKKLVRLYAELKEEPPESIKRLAGVK